MHLLQHILLSLNDEYEYDGCVDLIKFKETVPYISLPDTIRFYTKDRKYSHFEINDIDCKPNTNPFNGMSYPLDIKDIKQDKLMLFNSDTNIDKGVIGGDTSLDYFKCMNKHLPKMYLNEIREHLEQDIWYDNWVRSTFDCSDSGNNNFYLRIANDKIYLNGEEFRDIINILESNSLMFVIDYIREQHNLIIDQEFIDEYILGSMKKYYDEDMYKNTAKFFNLEEIYEKSKEIPDYIDLSSLDYCKDKQIKFILSYITQEEYYLPRSRSNWA